MEHKFLNAIPPQIAFLKFLLDASHKGVVFNFINFEFPIFRDFLMPRIPHCTI